MGSLVSDAGLSTLEFWTPACQHSFWTPFCQHSMATLEFRSVMRSFFTNTNCETSGNLIYWSTVANQEKKEKTSQRKKRVVWSIKMPFGNVPKKNPGRYFEQFVKVLEPKQSQSSSSSSSSSSTCFGSPAVGYCNSQGPVGRTSWEGRGGVSSGGRQGWNQNWGVSIPFAAGTEEIKLLTEGTEEIKY